MRLVTCITNKIDLRIVQWSSTKNPISVKKLGFFNELFLFNQTLKAFS